MLLLGKPVSEKIYSEIKTETERSGMTPGLGVILVGDDHASHLYVGLKEKAAVSVGIFFEKRLFPADATEEEIIQCITEWNDYPGIHGIIVQLPLPMDFDTEKILAAIDSSKDADGFLADTDSVPVFPAAIMELVKSAHVPLAGKKGIVCTNSERFGKTMAYVLASEGVRAEYVVLSSRTTEGSVAIQEGDTENISRLPRPDETSELAMTEKEKITTADIVVTALGRPEYFSRNDFKKGAIVIDGGIAKKDGKTVGDVSGEGDDADIFLSPVPGGVGPVTVACLLRRTVQLATKNQSDTGVSW